MIRKTFEVVGCTQVLGRFTTLRAQVEVPQNIGASELRNEKGFLFLSVNGVPRVGKETLGHVTDLTPDSRHLSLVFRPGGLRGLRSLLVRGLGKIIMEDAD